MENLLICGFNEKWHEKIVCELSRHYGSNKLVVISGNRIEIENSRQTSYYDIDDFGFGIYANLDVGRLPPIDAVLIEEMVFCESIYMNMLDRLELKKGKKLNYKERKEYYFKDLRIQNYLLQVNEIQLCIIDYIPHLGFDYVLYELCRLKGIKVVMQSYSLCIPFQTTSRYFLNNIQDPLPFVKNEYEKFKVLVNSGDADVEKSSYVRHYVDYYTRKREYIVSFVTVNSFAKAPPKVIKYIASTCRMIMRRDRRLIPAIKLRVSEPFRLGRIRRYLKRASSRNIIGDKYFYFPLHYQPECTSSPMAFSYVDQLIVISLISALLPEDVKLFVKPHPNPSLLADVNFYNSISLCKNTHLLPVEANTYATIDNSLGVVTLTGTAGWESIVRGKPVLMFGNYFYQYAPGVFHIRSAQDCEIAIRSIIDGAYSLRMEDIKCFVVSLEKYLVDGYLDGEYDQLYSIDPEQNINNTINGYIRFIEDDRNWSK